MKDKIEKFYDRNYKKLFIIPIVLFVIAFGILANHYRVTGDIINKDVTLKGGITATVYTEKTIQDLESSMKSNFPESDIVVRELIEFGTEKQIGTVVEVTKVSDEDLKSFLEEKFGIELSNENYSVEEVGSSLGEAFYTQMLTAILLAFLFMGIVVFIAFRTPIPSVAVVFAAFSDMVITLAVLNLIGVRLSTSGIAALLLLIGYSIDTDILLTTKVLKRKGEGTLFERLIDGTKTGLTMTFTTIVALTLAYIFSASIVLKGMFQIILIGLFADIVVTYLMNAGLLVWYARRKNL